MSDCSHCAGTRRTADIIDARNQELLAEVEQLRQALTNIQAAAKQQKEKAVPSHVRNDWLLAMCDYGLAKPQAQAEATPAQPIQPSESK